MLISRARVLLEAGRDIVVLSPRVLSCIQCHSPHGTGAARCCRKCFWNRKRRGARVY